MEDKNDSGIRMRIADPCEILDSDAPTRMAGMTSWLIRLREEASAFGQVEARGRYSAIARELEQLRPTIAGLASAVDRGEESAIARVGGMEALEFIVTAHSYPLTFQEQLLRLPSFDAAFRKAVRLVVRPYVEGVIAEALQGAGSVSSPRRT